MLHFPHALFLEVMAYKADQLCSTLSIHNAGRRADARQVCMLGERQKLLEQFPAGVAEEFVVRHGRLRSGA